MVCSKAVCAPHKDVGEKHTMLGMSTFGSCDVEKVRAVVARSRFRSQNVKNTRGSDHFWKLRCRKKVHALVARSTFPRHARTIFEGSDAVLRGRCKGFCTLPKVSKTWRFCSSFKSVGGRGTLEEDLERYISRGRRSTRDMFIRDVRRCPAGLGLWPAGRPALFVAGRPASWGLVCGRPAGRPAGWLAGCEIAGRTKLAIKGSLNQFPAIKFFSLAFHGYVQSLGHTLPQVCDD